MFDIVIDELVVLINACPPLIVLTLALNWACELLFGGGK